MKTIYLISCASKKLSGTEKAEKLYISPLFKLNLQYAKKINPDHIFILSAKHGLLSLKIEIENYNVTLNNMSVPELKTWSKKVLGQLKNKFDLDKDLFIFLAGQNYRQYLISNIRNYQVPL
jgi:hypothetical protein